MNILDLQNQLKNLSQEQLIQQMQAPTGEVPQFLLLSEITRRQKMRAAFEGQQGEDGTTVAEDAIAAAGVPAGFAGQMAGAMAPQTDMQGNTGAMPQAPMTPEEPAQVPGMAGGGIVALRDGGNVRTSELVVRNGRMFRRDPATGELVPLLGGETGAMTEPRPSPRVMDPTLGADLFGPRLSDVPPALPPASPATMPTAQGDIGQVWEYESPAPLWDPTASRAPAPPGDESISGEPAVPSIALVDSGIPIAVPEGVFGPSRERMSRYETQASERRARGETRRQASIDELLASAERARELGNMAAAYDFLNQAEELRASGFTQGVPLSFDDPVELLPSYVPPPGAEPPVTEDTVAPTDPQADPTTDPQVDPTVDPDASRDPAGPSGGGIASVAGAAGTAPTDFEQELLSMLAAREKRAEQDKWLALAQFGLQLMSSKEPTLGGAIGEAGGPALDALRSSRETAEGDRLGLLTTLEQHRMGQAQLALSQQAAAARAAGGGRSPGLTANQSVRELRAAAEFAQKEVERLTRGADPNSALQDFISSGRNQEAMQLRQAIAEAAFFRERALSATTMLAMQPEMLGGGSDDDFIDATLGGR